MAMWKLIPNFNNIYRVSSEGIVQSRRNKNGKTITKSWRNIALNNRNGYRFVVLYKDGKRHYLSVHRLVAEAFIPNPENKPQVNHINGNRADNRTKNLEWATAMENIQHSVHILHPDFGATKKRKIVQMDTRGNIARVWDSATEASRELRICRTHIINCCAHHCYAKTAGGYRWRYM